MQERRNVVLPGTPEHRNILEHPKNPQHPRKNLEHPPQKTQNTPRKPETPPKKPGTPIEIWHLKRTFVSTHNFIRVPRSKNLFCNILARSGFRDFALFLVFWKMFLIFWGVFRVFWGVFLVFWGYSGFSGGCSGFFGCSGVPVFRFFLKVLHAKKEWGSLGRLFKPLLCRLSLSTRGQCQKEDIIVSGKSLYQLQYVNNASSLH